MLKFTGDNSKRAVERQVVFKLVASDAWHVTMIWTPNGVLKTLAIVFQSNLLVQILETTVDALKLTLATAVTRVYFQLTSQYTRPASKGALYMHKLTLSFNLVHVKMSMDFPHWPNPPAAMCTPLGG